MKISKLRVDRGLANEGAWGNYAGAKFLIARYNNKAAETLRTTLVGERISEIQSADEAVSSAALEEINVEVLSRAVLLGWSGIEDDDGNAIEYSVEKAKELLADEGLAELRTFIQNYSFNRENYQVKIEEAVSESVKSTADS